MKLSIIHGNGCRLVAQLPMQTTNKKVNDEEKETNRSNFVWFCVCT